VLLGLKLFLRRLAQHLTVADSFKGIVCQLYPLLLVEVVVGIGEELRLGLHLICVDALFKFTSFSFDSLLIILGVRKDLLLDFKLLFYSAELNAPFLSPQHEQLLSVREGVIQFQ